MAGLYIHIPFCEKKCHYCDFVIAVGALSAERESFLDALEKESKRYRALTGDLYFETIYLGGGTPSQLTGPELEKLFGILKKNFRWMPDAEITCEANPGDMASRKAELLKELGVNRVSLGAQSFHDETLTRLGRAHDAAAIASSFRCLREAGFENINLDLILSLPGESWDKARVSLEKLAALGPEHVSIYELTIEEKTVFGTLRKNGKLALPEEEEQFETLSNTRDFLQRNGYRHYELLNYAKPGREARHNRLYWANEDTLALGPGAWSHWGGRRTRFADSYRQYLSKIASGDWSVIEDETLSVEKKEIESFVLALRLSEGAEMGRFGGVIGRLSRELEGLTDKGLVVKEEGRIRLTGRGQFFAETVFAELSA